MLFTPYNSKGLMLVDEFGNPINNAFEFDDSTKIAKVYLCNKHGKFIVNARSVAKAEIYLPGARMVPKAGIPMTSSTGLSAKPRITIKLKCTCGAAKCGGQHSDWCDAKESK